VWGWGDPSHDIFAFFLSLKDGVGLGTNNRFHLFALWLWMKTHTSKEIKK